MMVKKWTKNRLGKAIFGCLFAILGMFGILAVGPTTNVYADPPTTTTPTTEPATEPTTTEPTATTQETSVSCEDSLGALSWLICPTTGKFSEAVDWLYEKIEQILIIKPVEMKDGTPIYEIWKYARGITNIVFIILFLVVIYSQITGIGITNYGIKKILPKMIVVAILVNLSFIICSIAVDVSNIVGNGLRGVFTSIEESTMASLEPGAISGVTLSQMYSSMAGGTALAIGAGIIAFETGSVWMLIPLVLGALVSVVSGLITIALRQAVVALLIMISPLAMVAYMLPNTESLFKKWKKLLTQMLVFYPMFSLLFGASNLAGWAIITSAKDGFTLMLGIAVQIFPLFFSWSLMKMSGTFLSTINGKIQGLAARPLAINRAWADSNRQLMKQKNLASSKAYTPSLRLMQFMSNRKIMREEETAEHATTVKLRGQAYAAMRNYRKDGTPSAEGEESYELQARNMRYQKQIMYHKNNMNKGMGQLESVKNRNNAAQIARLKALDNANVEAADELFAESARGERIDQINAAGRHKRFEDAINAHMDEINRYTYDTPTGLRGDREDYKLHFAGDATARAAAQARYDALNKIMEGSKVDTQYAAASASQVFDTQKKIMEAKMQKYFELTPPTKDLEYRLAELTKSQDAIMNIDTIISGLRILNQRGDTDLVKKQLDYILENGVELGTHASQSLASFLMFEVKDNDPVLRRFGKYINLETANVYNKNKRKEPIVTYDEYIKGYHYEPNGEKVFAKKDLVKLIEGTSLDNIERTAFSNLDESLKKAYGFDEENPQNEWDVKGWMEKREQIQTAFEPAFLSSSLKWLSGSEQINSAVKFWTGYELSQKKDEDGNLVIDPDTKEPVYELSAVWDDKKSGLYGNQDAKEYFRRKTYDYFKDQTTGQILGMRTDYRDPTIEHLIDMYLNDKDESDATLADRKQRYENAKSEIENKYNDITDSKKRNEKRRKDLAALKRGIAGVQLRKILDGTGKLEQIYTTRRSGASNNAKDWLRQMLNLDDKDEIYRYLDQKEKELKEKKANKSQEDSSGDSAPRAKSPYSDKSTRVRVTSELHKILDESGDDPDPDASFYEESMDFLEHEFGADGEVVVQYKDYVKNHGSRADRNELFSKLEELLGNFFFEHLDDQEE